ncbi:hypothetical protein BGZ70_008154 [Mortierella alpina]|uniref:Peptidase A1 domain-containing protein n=1 Tax=Mortierella alpina TaxID=64518 RepID=A0A9P6M250_MORAP|nr:hypothetical protein BGZ70_008154 [Mortierella alpina]
MHPTITVTLTGLSLLLMSINLCPATSSVLLSDLFLPTFEHPVRFKLDRHEPFSSALAARSLSEPCGPEERSATMEPVVVEMPLTGIPKDYGYTATFSIGTYDTDVQDRLFHLLIDTGSDLVVLTSEDCTDPECLKVPHRFNCSASLTCAPVINTLTGNERAVQRYGDGTKAEGRLVQDTVRFVAADPVSELDTTTTTTTNSACTGLTLLDQSMLLVDRPGLRLFKSYGSAVDGILGLNLGSPVITKTVIQNLRNMTLTTLQDLPPSGIPPSSLASLSSSSTSFSYFLDQPLSLQDSAAVGIGFMSLWLGHSYERGQGGELLLNAVDPSRFKGPVLWTERGPSPYDWTVPLDRGLWLLDPLSGQEEAPLVGSALTYAVMDSGSDGIYLQRSMYDALFQKVAGARQLAETGYWRVPCEGTMELVFGIQGETYRIPYADWVKKPSLTTTTESANASANATMMESGINMCKSRVYGSSPGPILLGSTFMRTVYTIFDFSRPGQERVGLARLA